MPLDIGEVTNLLNDAARNAVDMRLPRPDAMDVERVIIMAIQREGGNYANLSDNDKDRLRQSFLTSYNQYARLARRRAGRRRKTRRTRRNRS